MQVLSSKTTQLQHDLQRQGSRRRRRRRKQKKSSMELLSWFQMMIMMISCLNLLLLFPTTTTTMVVQATSSSSSWGLTTPGPTTTTFMASSTTDDTTITTAGTTTTEIDMGTTLIALKCKQGVIVGADTQTSSSTYVSNRFAHKLDSLWLDPFDHYDDDDSNNEQDEEDEKQEQRRLRHRRSKSSCIVCRSGSAADTQFLVRQCQWEFTSSPRWMRWQDVQPEIQSTPTISQVAHYLRYLIRQGNNNDGGNGSGSGEPLQASLICAGYDSTATTGRIFAITPGGTILEEPLVSVSGSGSTYLLGHLDQTFQKQRRQKQQQRQRQRQQQQDQNNEDNKEDTTTILLEEDDAIELVVKLIRLSIARDASSGGWIRLVVLNAQGQHHLTFPPTTTTTETEPQTGQTTTTTGEDEGMELPGFARVKPFVTSTTTVQK